MTEGRRGRGGAAPHRVSGVEVVHTAEGCIPLFTFEVIKTGPEPNVSPKHPLFAGSGATVCRPLQFGIKLATGMLAGNLRLTPTAP
jgi:hypothetical protein